MATRISRAIGAFVLICGLHLFLYTQLTEAARNGGWPTIVMHNWHEAGFWQLGGQLVANPGGLNPGEALFIYPGHRPFFLYLPYILKELPGEMGGDGLFYDFVMLALVYSSVLWLLGAGFRGILIATAVCLSPGIFRNIIDVDTLGVTFLMGLIVMNFAGASLARHETNRSTRFLALAAMALFMVLNWPTLFSLAIAAVYILCKRADWKNVAGYLAIALVVGLGVLAVSMQSRHATGAYAGTFWNAYLWGPLGYDGQGMDTGKAVVRLAAVNTVAWLPLVISGLAVLLSNGLGTNWRRAPLPLLASIVTVLTLRNYNAHHPWNAVCQIGLGLVFSLELLTGLQPVTSLILKRTVASLSATFSVVYVFAWIAFFLFNSRDFDPIFAMVATQTPRHASIVITENISSAGTTEPKALESILDRKCFSLEEWNQRDPLIDQGNVYLLSHTGVPSGAKFIAQSQTRPTWTDWLVAPVLDFYRTKISRRSVGDRRLYYDEYQLSKP